MPFSPSDIPWWGWLLCAVMSGIVCLIAAGICEETDGKISGTIAVLSGATGSLVAIIGIIRFVKWVWSG